MRSFALILAVISIAVLSGGHSYAELSDAVAPNIDMRIDSGRFPNLKPPVNRIESIIAENSNKTTVETNHAVWPFGDKQQGSNVQRKSPRKAFFLSALLPGLGETYVGAKRGIIMMGIEAFAWYYYTTNTKKGKDIEDDYQLFADTYWHYTDELDSNGEQLDINYWKWVQAIFDITGKPSKLDPYSDYAIINKQLEEAVNHTKSPIRGYSIHHLPATKTQQYYEMIGKYPQFVYGWEDIDDYEIVTDPETGEESRVYLNPTIVKEDGSIKYDENIRNIKSDLRTEYEDMRDESNQKLKQGQRGVHLMILNRVISSIQAARLAYLHNKKIDSELSQINIRFTERNICGDRVTMLYVSKKF